MVECYVGSIAQFKGSTAITNVASVQQGMPQRERSVVVAFDRDARHQGGEHDIHAQRICAVVNANDVARVQMVGGQDPTDGSLRTARTQPIERIIARYSGPIASGVYRSIVDIIDVNGSCDGKGAVAGVCQRGVVVAGDTDPIIAADGQGRRNRPGIRSRIGRIVRNHQRDRRITELIFAA